MPTKIEWCDGIRERIAIARIALHEHDYVKVEDILRNLLAEWPADLRVRQLPEGSK